MTDRPIPDEIAIRFAKLINAAEDMRQQAADDLRTIYADMRDDLKALGWGGKEISAELAGFKGAIAELRLDDEAKAKRSAKDDRIDVYADMLRLAGARARIREGRPATAQGRGAGQGLAGTPHDPETGEITEEKPSVGSPSDSTGQATRPADESVAADDAAGEPNSVVRFNPHSARTSSLASEQPETPTSSPVVSGAHSDLHQSDAASEAAGIASASLFINPRCQQPDTCHRVHTKDDCFECSLAWSKRPRDEQRALWQEAERRAEVAA